MRSKITTKKEFAIVLDEREAQLLRGLVQNGHPDDHVDVLKLKKDLFEALTEKPLTGINPAQSYSDVF